MPKTDELIAQINVLRRKEIYEMQKAGQFALAIAKLKAKQLKHIEQAKSLFNQRKDLAIEYNHIKTPSTKLLQQIEKELGRKLIYEEVIEIEKAIHAKREAKN